ncbi:MAG: S1 family peptidase [Dehalococcoidia bacterium]|nr:S1 family peptidase [Dehalococcoidia bacterium]
MLNNAIDEYGDIEFNAKFGISGFSVNEITNVVDIGMFDRAKESTVLAYLEANVEGFTPRSVVFNDGCETVPTVASSTATTALAGDEINRPIAGGSVVLGSIGFNAYTQIGGVKTYGVVTAGHFADLNDVAYNVYGTKIGLCTISNFFSVNGGNCKLDVAFIPISVNPSGPSITPSSKVSNNIWNSTEEDVRGIRYDYDIVVGMDVLKIGRTTGYNTGYVSSKGITGSSNSYYYTDQLKTTNYCAGGDSGGMLGEWVAGISGGVFLIGITSMSDSTYGYFTMADNIAYYLGIYPVTK